MRKLFTLCLLVFSLSASAQWQQTGSKVRYVNGLGIPTRDTAAGVAADSSQILIRPADSSLYVKYKRTWLRVGGGGGSIAGSGTTNYIPKFTSSTAIGNSQIFDNGTSVGIGTVSPGSILDIREANRSNSTNITNLGIYTTTAQSTDIGGTIGLGGLFNGSNIAPFGSIRGGKENSTSGNYDGYLAFQTIPNNGTLLERMRISSAGNVGIGTAIPSEKLHLVGNTFRQNDASNSFGYTISTTSATTTFATLFGGSSFGIRTGGSGSDNMRITSGGNALIGTTTDNGTDRLQVSGSMNVSGNVGIGTLSAATLSMQVEKDVNNAHVTSLKNRNSGSAATTNLTLANDANLGLEFSINSTTASGTFWGFSRSNLVSNEVLNFNSNWVFNLGNSIGSIAFGLNGNEAFRIPQSRRILFNTTTDNGTDRLQVNGSIQGTGFNQAYTARTTTYTATTSDYFIDCTSGTFTVNLFTAVGNTGRILIIKNSGTGTITVDPNGSQTIDGATTQTLSTQWSRVHIISDGANWKIISN